MKNQNRLNKPHTRFQYFTQPNRIWLIFNLGISYLQKNSKITVYEFSALRVMHFRKFSMLWKIYPIFGLPGGKILAYIFHI